MHYQSKRNYCGPATVQNALELFGIKATQKDIAELAHTTAEGTNEYGMIRAINHYGLDALPVISATTYSMSPPALACIDRWAHWVLVAGEERSLGRYIVIDPARTAYNRARNGVWVPTYEQLHLKMRPALGESEAFYWIHVRTP